MHTLSQMLYMVSVLLPEMVSTFIFKIFIEEVKYTENIRKHIYPNDHSFYEKSSYEQGSVQT